MSLLPTGPEIQAQFDERLRRAGWDFQAHRQQPVCRVEFRDLGESSPRDETPTKGRHWLWRRKRCEPNPTGETLINGGSAFQVHLQYSPRGLNLMWFVENAQLYPLIGGMLDVEATLRCAEQQGLIDRSQSVQQQFEARLREAGWDFDAHRLGLVYQCLVEDWRGLIGLDQRYEGRCPMGTRFQAWLRYDVLASPYPDDIWYPTSMCKAFAAGGPEESLADLFIRRMARDDRATAQEADRDGIDRRDIARRLGESLDR
jgi:hypothetical protein